MENKIFSMRLRPYFEELMQRPFELQEIRMRSGKPIIYVSHGKEGFLIHQGKKILAEQQDLDESMAYISQYSIYTYENQIKKGFITIKGGHRVGISGEAVIENGTVKIISPITSLNIRIAHSVQNCADHLYPKLKHDGYLCHTMIVSPPGRGKTTLLREVIRLASNEGYNVGIVDERSEIAACYHGIPQNDVGIRTDVLDHCPKHLGIEMMIRTMAPDVLAFDEMGDELDLSAARYAMHCGCTILTTLHGRTMEDVFKRCGKLMFERYVFLNDWKEKDRIAYIVNDRQEKIHVGT